MMFMHIVPWEHRLANGNTTIQQVYDDHFAGVNDVLSMAQAWRSLDGKVDRQRFSAISDQFDRHILQCQIWRDVLVSFYFDNARMISTQQPWIQLEMSEARTFENPALLLGGMGNDVPISLTNATDRPRMLKVSLAQPLSGWAANAAEKELPPRESGILPLFVQPPLEPYLGPIVFACDPAGFLTLGFDTQIVIVTPTADKCTFAFDVGSPANTVVPGYRALTAQDIWDGSSRFGWVGTPPRDTRLATTWDLLQDDCASDSVPRTLRLRISPGEQRAWVLIGGQGSGTQPVRVTLGSDTLVQTGYIEESMFRWFGFTLHGDAHGKTVDLPVAGADGRYWRLAALVVLQPGL
jgi:alpha-glucuronidase